ncbi:MAG: Divalent-cation tolerance protein CutA [Syntrophorhabdus sp. PtaU1.Bin058]|nr:MAG: Divalent-cation tolerance protein CutA [Syntrophorhabdus sp. PtaU1.Bin058]
MTGIIKVITTGDNRDIIEDIGRKLVEMRLAACAQIAGPIKSIYWWKGKTEEAEEWYCILKTTENLYKKVEGAIIKLHPYELPEIMAVRIDEALPAYVQWVMDETKLPAQT